MQKTDLTVIIYSMTVKLVPLHIPPTEEADHTSCLEQRATDGPAAGSVLNNQPPFSSRAVQQAAGCVAHCCSRGTNNIWSFLLH